MRAKYLNYSNINILRIEFELQKNFEILKIKERKIKSRNIKKSSSYFQFRETLFWKVNLWWSLLLDTKSSEKKSNKFRCYINLSFAQFDLFLKYKFLTNSSYYNWNDRIWRKIVKSRKILIFSLIFLHWKKYRKYE